MDRIARFLLVGGAATAIHFGVLVLAVELAHVPATLASTAGFLVSAIANYLLNYRFTFRSNAAHGGAALRFACVALAGLVINAAMMGLLAQVAGWPYLLAQVLATGCVLAWNFCAHASWTFAQPRLQDARE